MRATNKNTAAVKTLKEMIKAEYFEAIELAKYGIQIYNATEGNEYDVITKAEKYNGRYYFITREGRRVAWSSLESDKLDHACNDFIDNVKRDMTAETSENTTIYHNVTAARVGYLANVIADAVGVAFGSSLPSNDIKFDLQSFYNWQNSNGEATETTDPRDLFFIAIRKQGSEAGTRRHVRERCKVLGRPVYVLRISHEYDTDGRELAGRYRLAVRATTKDPLNNDDTNESKEPERPAANDANESDTANVAALNENDREDTAPVVIDTDESEDESNAAALNVDDTNDDQTGDTAPESEDESDTDGTPDTAPTTAPTAPTAQGGTLPGLSAAACVYLPIL